MAVGQIPVQDGAGDEDKDPAEQEAGVLHQMVQQPLSFIQESGKGHGEGNQEDGKIGELGGPRRTRLAGRDKDGLDEKNGGKESGAAPHPLRVDGMHA